MKIKRSPPKIRVLVAILAATGIAMMLAWHGGQAGAAGAASIGTGIIILATRVVEKED